MRYFFCALIAAAVIFIAFLLVRALRLRPAKTAGHAPYAPDLDEDGALRRFGETIRLQTVWPRYGEVDTAPFKAFLPLLQRLYPKMFSVLEVNTVNDYGLLLRWKGTGDGDPVVLMSHYDVVSGDPDKWTHPPRGLGQGHGRYQVHPCRAAGSGRNAARSRFSAALRRLVFLYQQRGDRRQHDACDRAVAACA